MGRGGEGWERGGEGWGRGGYRGGVGREERTTYILEELQDSHDKRNGNIVCTIHSVIHPSSLHNQ